MYKKAEGKILILEHPTTKSSNDRVEGFADTVEGNGNFEIVGRLDYAGQLEIANCKAAPPHSVRFQTDTEPTLRA